MTQANVGTIDPDNTSGTELAALISNFEDALLTYHGGSSRPSYAVKNMIWVDEDGDDDTFYLHTGSADVPLYQHDLSDGVMRMCFSGNLDTYIKPGSTSGLFIFSAGVEALDLTSTRMNFYNKHVIGDDRVKFGDTTEGGGTISARALTDGVALELEAGQVASGNSVRNALLVRFTNDETEAYLIPSTDGTTNFNARLYCDMAGGAGNEIWGTTRPFELRATGTASAAPANGVVIYAEDISSSAELRVRDEAGNVTTLSPHNFDLIDDKPESPLAWSYYSEKWEGKKLIGKINVDMYRVVRLLEQLTGEKLIHEEMEPT